jgi:hypothetical protein
MFCFKEILFERLGGFNLIVEIKELTISIKK